jgi:hypothetical protein
MILKPHEQVTLPGRAALQGNRKPWRAPSRYASPTLHPDPRTIASPGSDCISLLQQSSIRTIQASEVQVTDFLIHGLSGLPGRYIIRAGQGSPCQTRSDVKALTASYLNDSRGRSGKPTTLEDFVKKFGFRGN